MKEHIGFTPGDEFTAGDVIKCVNNCNFALIKSVDANGWPILQMLNNNPEIKRGSSLPIKCTCAKPCDVILAPKGATPEPEDAPKKRRGRSRKVENTSEVAEAT